MLKISNAFKSKHIKHIFLILVSHDTNHFPFNPLFSIFILNVYSNRQTVSTQLPVF